MNILVIDGQGGQLGAQHAATGENLVAGVPNLNTGALIADAIAKVKELLDKVH